MRLLKRSIYNAAELTFAQACDEIAAKTAITDQHPDAKEGEVAFREKRRATVQRLAGAGLNRTGTARRRGRALAGRPGRAS